jgi:hypothetical protein
MPEINGDPIEVLKKIAESHRQIRFGRGVVGRTSYATIAILGIWAVVVARLSENLLLDGALLLGGLISTGIYCWWVKGTHRYAKENPALALLEGAELLEYQRFEAQVKGGPDSGRLLPINNPYLPSKKGKHSAETDE